MQAVNSLLYFLNKLDFAGYLETDDYKKINCLKKVLTIQSQDVNSENLINMLNIVDDLYIFF